MSPLFFGRYSQRKRQTSSYRPLLEDLESRNLLAQLAFLSGTYTGSETVTVDGTTRSGGPITLHGELPNEGASLGSVKAYSPDGQVACESDLSIGNNGQGKDLYSLDTAFGDTTTQGGEPYTLAASGSLAVNVSLTIQAENNEQAGHPATINVSLFQGTTNLTVTQSLSIADGQQKMTLVPKSNTETFFDFASKVGDTITIQGAVDNTVPTTQTALGSSGIDPASGQVSLDVKLQNQAAFYPVSFNRDPVGGFAYRYAPYQPYGPEAPLLTPVPTPIALYWASGTTYSTALGLISGSAGSIPAGTTSFGQGTFPASLLVNSQAPAGTNDILFVVGDPESADFDPAVDVQYLPYAPAEWTGKGSNNLWSTGDNWLGGVAPMAGENLDFPADAQQQTNVNDLGGVNFGAVTVEGGNYAFSGQALGVSGVLDFQGGSTELDCSTTTGGSTTVEAGANVTVGVNATLKVLSSDPFNVAGGLSLLGNCDAAGEVSVDAGGNLNVGATGNFTCEDNSTVDFDGMQTIDDGGLLSLNGTSHLNLLGTLNSSGDITADAQSDLTVQSSGILNIGKTLSLFGNLDCSGNATVRSGAQLNASASSTFTCDANSKVTFAGTQTFANGSTLVVDSELDLQTNGQLNSSGNVTLNGKFNSSGNVTLNSQSKYNLSANAVWTQAGGNASIYGSAEIASGGTCQLQGGAEVTQYSGNFSLDGKLNCTDGTYLMQASAGSTDGAVFTFGAQGNANFMGSSSQLIVGFGDTLGGDGGTLSINGAFLYVRGKVSGTLSIADTNLGIVVEPGAVLDVSNSLTEGMGGRLDDLGTVSIEPGATLNIVGTVSIEPGATFNALGTVTGTVTYPAPTVTSPTSPVSVSTSTIAIKGAAQSSSTVFLYSDPEQTGSISGSAVSLVSSQTAAANGSYSFTVLLTPGAINHYFVTAKVSGTQTAITDAPAITQALPAPAVTSISPASGSAAGGTTVTITGTDLGDATAVYFGSTPATDFTVNSATQITATAPAATGTVDVTVDASGGASATTSADQFTYGARVIAAPMLTGLSVPSGPTAGGTSVTITGSNFAGATGVSFGGIPATSFVVVSATQITATDPPEPAGPVDVIVTTAGGASATSSADRFIYTTPSSSGGNNTGGNNTGGNNTSGNNNGGGNSTGGNSSVVSGISTVALAAPKSIKAHGGLASLGKLTLRDTNPHATLKVHVSASHGQLKLQGHGVKIKGNNSRSLTVTGSIAAVQAALRKLSLALGKTHGKTTVTVSSSDGMQTQQANITVQS